LKGYRMKKVLFLDLETTGLDPDKHGIVQLAFIAEIDGQVVEEKLWNINPGEYVEYDPKALEINGLTLAQIQTFQPYEEVYLDVINFLGRHVDRFNKYDKFIINGYNVEFDIGFLKKLFLQDGERYFNSWFDYKSIDVFALVKILDIEGLRQRNKNQKLTTICENEGVSLVNAHDALADIRATRELYYHLIDKYMKK